MLYDFFTIACFIEERKKTSPSNAKNVNLQHRFISLQHTARTRFKQVIAGRQANLREYGQAKRTGTSEALVEGIRLARLL